MQPVFTFDQELISKQLQEQKASKEINLYDFLWAFLQVLEHDREEELFITNALIEFFNHAKE